MTDKSAEILTQMITDLRALNVNDVQIAIDLLGSAVPVLIEASGVTSTANFLISLADQVKTHETELEMKTH